MGQDEGRIVSIYLPCDPPPSQYCSLLGLWYASETLVGTVPGFRHGSLRPFPVISSRILRRPLQSNRFFGIFRRYLVYLPPFLFAPPSMLAQFRRHALIQHLQSSRIAIFPSPSNDLLFHSGPPSLLFFPPRHHGPVFSRTEFLFRTPLFREQVPSSRVLPIPFYPPLPVRCCFLRSFRTSFLKHGSR